MEIAVDKIYGPYQRNSDKRWIIIVNGKTISYPKYLYQKHHNLLVEEPWTVDHIDNNPQNNAIENLQLLTRDDNAAKTKKGIQRELRCACCRKIFYRILSQRVHILNYCSRECRNLFT